MKLGSRSDIEWVSEEQAQFFASVLEFSRTLPREGMIERDRSNTFSWDAWKRCGEFGIQGLPAPEEYGGGGADVVTTMLALEALGYGCTDNGLVFSINAHMWTSVVPIWHFGTEEQSGVAAGALLGRADRLSRDHRARRRLRSVLDAALPRSDRRRWVRAERSEDVHHERADRRPRDRLRPNGRRASGPFGITAFLVAGRNAGHGRRRARSRRWDCERRRCRRSSSTTASVPESAVLGRVGRGARGLPAVDAVGASLHHGEPGRPDASDDGGLHRVRAASAASSVSRSAGSESVADKIADMRVAVDAGRALVLRVGLAHGPRAGHDARVRGRQAVRQRGERPDAISTPCRSTAATGTRRSSRSSERFATRSAARIYSGTSEIQRRIIARGWGSEAGHRRRHDGVRPAPVCSHERPDRVRRNTKPSAAAPTSRPTVSCTRRSDRSPAALDRAGVRRGDRVGAVPAQERRRGRGDLRDR